MGFFTPSELLTYRFFLGSLTLVAIRPGSISQLTRAKCKLALPTAAVLSVSMLTLWQGVKYSDTGLSAFLANSEFILIPIILYFFFKQKISLMTGVLVLTGLVGMALLSLQQGLNISVGTSFLLASATCFAFYAILNTELTKKIAPFELSLLNLSLSTVFCAFAAIFEGFTFNFSLDSTLPLLYLGPIILGIRFLFITYGQSKVRASHAGLIYLCEPISASLIGCFLMSETFSSTQLLGILILIATVLGSFFVVSQEEAREV